MRIFDEGRQPTELKQNQPVVVAGAGLGAYWIMPAPCIYNVPEGSVRKASKEEVFAYLEKHFPDWKFTVDKE